MSVRMLVRSLASLSGLRIWHCHERWCRSQMLLKSSIARAVMYTSASALIWPLAWNFGTSICFRYISKKKKKISYTLTEFCCNHQLQREIFKSSMFADPVGFHLLFLIYIFEAGLLGARSWWFLYFLFFFFFFFCCACCMQKFLGQKADP